MLRPRIASRDRSQSRWNYHASFEPGVSQERIQTSLNRVANSGRLCTAMLTRRGGGPNLVVKIEPRKNSPTFCSGCGRRGRANDGLEQRPFEFAPTRSIRVFFSVPDAMSGLQAAQNHRGCQESCFPISRKPVMDSILFINGGIFQRPYRRGTQRTGRSAPVPSEVT